MAGAYPERQLSNGDECQVVPVIAEGVVVIVVGLPEIHVEVPDGPTTVLRTLDVHDNCLHLVRLTGQQAGHPGANKTVD